MSSRRPLVAVLAAALVVASLSGCKDDSDSPSSAPTSAVVTETTVEAPISYPDETTEDVPSSSSSSSVSLGSASRKTCEEFSQLDAGRQESVVQDMMSETGQTGYGVEIILPNVRAMCATYPPDTQIYRVFTG